MAFSGFPKDGLAFLRELGAHNERDWFEAHRAAWDELIVPAMLSLCSELQERLAGEMPLQLVPRIGGSLYRLNRDTRFSKDKSPYKTHTAAILWDGPDKHESPGLYVHIAPDAVIFGGGIWVFEEGMLDRYRKRVAHEKAGEKLSAALAHAKKAGLLSDAHEKLVKVPRGFSPEHPRAELLKQKGLVVAKSQKPGAWLHTREALDRAVAAARGYAPVHAWLKSEVAGAR
jgi:uncharacterized protein (TIGR02453 family)